MSVVIFLTGFAAGLVAFAFFQDCWSQSKDRPVLIVKVGSDENPATADDINEVREEFEKNCKGGQVVVTHHYVSSKKV